MFSYLTIFELHIGLSDKALINLAIGLSDLQTILPSDR